MGRLEAERAESEEKIRFFFEHGKSAWAVKELARASGAGMLELAASTLDAAAKASSLGPGFEDWMDLALSLRPDLWMERPQAWAGALAALAAKEDPRATPFIEELMVAAPAAILSLPHSESESVRQWLSGTLSERHGPWIQALDALEAAGHSPQRASKSALPPREPVTPFALLDAPCASVNEMIKGGELAQARRLMGQAHEDDRPYIALATLGMMIHHRRSLLSFESLEEVGLEEDDLGPSAWDQWVDLACGASLACKMNFRDAWCFGMKALCARLDKEESWAFDRMAEATQATMLASGRVGPSNLTWGQVFAESGGELAEIAGRMGAHAESSRIDSSLGPVSPLRKALGKARRKRPGL